MFPLLALMLLAAAFDASMTSQEMKQTGMAKLSSKEKTALQNWIDAHYTKKEVVAGPKTAAKPAILEENLKNGSYIRLTDNSLWEINPADTPITQGWITPVEIKVTTTNDTSYPYTLTNSLTSSKVRARKVETTTPSAPLVAPPKK
jgi:hypothetical protein